MTPLRVSRLVVPWPALLGMALAMLGIEIAAVASHWDVVRSWASVVEAVDGAWPVVGILTAGCAAAVAVRPQYNRELTVALPDSGARTAAITGVVVGVVAAGVHVLVVVGLLTWGWVVNLPGSPGLWPVLGVLAALFACSMFGTALARLRMGLLTPVLAMGLFVVVLYVIRALGGVALIDLGGVTVVLVGLAPDPETMVWRAAWLAGVGAIAWCFAAYGRGSLRAVVVWALVPVTLALAIVTMQKAESGFAQTPVEWVCDSGPPRVCVAAEYEDRLDEYAAVIAELAPYADAVGLPPPPGGYRQTVGLSPGVGSFNVATTVSGWRLAFDLVQFSYPCSDQWTAPQFQLADSVTAWLASQIDAPLPPDPALRVPSSASAQAAVDQLECGR